VSIAILTFYSVEGSWKDFTVDLGEKITLENSFKKM